MENSCVIGKLQRNTCYKFRVSIGRKKRIHCGGKLIRMLLWKVNWSIWHERGTKKIWVPDRNPPMTSRTPGSRSIYWGTRTYGEQCHFGVWEAMVGFNSCRGLRFCLCPTLVSYWLIHLSHFIINLSRMRTNSMTHHVYWSCKQSRRLDYQPLFGKWARAPPPKFFSGRVDLTRESGGNRD